MRRYSICLFLFLLAVPLNIRAQKLFVEQMLVTKDLSASRYRRIDTNGDPCGLIKVQLAAADAKFEGNIIEPVDYKNGEYWVYMTKGSRELHIKLSGYIPIELHLADYKIPLGVQPLTTYRLTVLMPQSETLSVGEQRRKVADAYVEGRQGKEHNYSEAFNNYIEAAELNDPISMTEVGFRYMTGQGVEKDSLKAVEWFTKAIPLLQKAAENEDAEAQNELSRLYSCGYGINKDEIESRKWFLKSAENGYAQAQFMLGLEFEHGSSEDKDGQMAVYWYLRAASQGHTAAMEMLANMYEKGDAVEKNKSIADKWYKKLFEIYSKQATEGNHQGQYNLGRLYELGNGVSLDLEKAKYWYREAAKQGDEWAKWRLDELK